MNIRKSTLEDLPRLMEIYREGREIMLSGDSRLAYQKIPE